MSGLAALFHRDRQPVNVEAVRAMLDAIPHRAIDGAWVRVWPGVGLGLGYAKLTVTPEEENELQPLVSSRTGCVLIADVRLDNRQELVKHLPERGLSAASDAELILHAYDVWGLDMPKHLLGDYAFVLWDPRSQRLLLARDTSGQRTLFFRDDGRTFAAASELHQLLQDPAVALRPNDNRIRDSLVPANVYRNSKEQAETFYEGLFTVPAGHSLVVTREAGIRPSRYWDLNPRAELRYRHDREYADHFRSLFFDVVQSRLRSSRPLGATLSGGLDSSSVVCTAQELFRAGRAVDNGFTTFSMVFDGLDCDERPLIEATRAKYGFAARYTRPPAFGGLVRLEPRYFAEEPQTSFGDGEDPLIRAVFEQGVRVLLSGDVADAYVGGSRMVFDSQLRQGHFSEFLHDFGVYRRLADESLHKSLVVSCLVPLLPLRVQRQALAAHARRFLRRNSHRLVPDWLETGFQEELRHRHLTLSLDMLRNQRFASPAREESYQMLYPPLVARNPFGWPVEICRPYADRRLHEFMLAIPPEQHFRPHPDTHDFYAGSKRLVREGLKGILPEAIRTLTSKVGFGSLYENDVLRSWPSYDAAFGPSARPEIVERGYVDHQRLWRRLERLRDGNRGGDFIYLIRILGLETWLRGLRQPRASLVTVPAPWRIPSLDHRVALVPEVRVGLS